MSGRDTARPPADTEAQAVAIADLEAAEPRTRREAARRLGRCDGPAVEAALVQALAREQLLPERRAIVEALGKCGGAAALTAVTAANDPDPLLQRLRERALVRLRGRLARGAATPLALTARFAPADVLLHVRPGLEELLASELPADLEVSSAGRGRLRVAGVRSLVELYRARTFLHLGFALAPEPLRPQPDAVPEAVARVLARPATQDLLLSFGPAPIRWRLHWTAGGHRRAETFATATATARRAPELVNDPREAPWQVSVTERHERVHVELRPLGLPDPRFPWRRATVPASSHETVAAALALVAGIDGEDTAWDPFVGAAAELVERGLAGPFRRLLGTDLDDAALTAARTNADLAGVPIDLERADARSFTPPFPVTLLLTNPPLGHRVGDPRSASALLVGLLERRRTWLAPGGRIVWLSPTGDTTAAAAQRVGLTVGYRKAVDLGGVRAELQLLRDARRG